MARPIRNTPILYGNDAKNFNLAALHVTPEGERMDERERIKLSVEQFCTFLNHIDAN